MEREALGFVMYKDYMEYFGFLTKEEKADVMDAVFAYAFCEKEPEGLTKIALLAFTFVKNQIERDREKYDRKCERNRKNGSLGGRPPKKEEEKLEESEAFEEEEEKEEASCAADVAEEDDFEIFWEKYPKKSDREAAACEFRRLSPDKALFSRMMSALEIQKQSEEWQKERGRFVPRPSAWILRREWEKYSTKAQTSEFSEKSFDTDDFFEAALRRGYEEIGFSDG